MSTSRESRILFYTEKSKDRHCIFCAADDDDEEDEIVDLFCIRCGKAKYKETLYQTCEECERELEISK